MALHGLLSVTIAVPDVAKTVDYYTEFGLTSEGDGWLSTTDGGRQLALVEAPVRRLVEISIGVDDPADVQAVARRLTGAGTKVEVSETELTAIEPVMGTRITLQVADRISQTPPPDMPYNVPGRTARRGKRAPGVVRNVPVRPRRLGHVVVGSPDYESSARFFVEGLGFKVSDQIKNVGSFMRCSSDHHNVLVLNAPTTFLHHTSWQVDDVDEIGRGAMHMLEGHPERHVWGPGRHYAGSNFFWYLRDPAGNFTEYFSDLDSIEDDQDWTAQIVDGPEGLFKWGPPPPAEFIEPADIADIMAASR